MWDSFPITSRCLFIRASKRPSVASAAMHLFSGGRAALPHAANLVLLPAAAWAGVVTADAFTAMPDGLDLDVLASIDRLLLLAGDLAGALSLIVTRRGFNPGGTNKLLVKLLHSENEIGHALAHCGPHLLEQAHSFTFVFDLGIKLCVTGEPNGTTEVVHRQ